MSNLEQYMFSFGRRTELLKTRDRLKNELTKANRTISHQKNEIHSMLELEKELVDIKYAEMKVAAKVIRINELREQEFRVAIRVLAEAISKELVEVFMKEE